jgi:hypothetical protein
MSATVLLVVAKMTARCALPPPKHLRASRGAVARQIFVITLTHAFHEWLCRRLNAATDNSSRAVAVKIPTGAVGERGGGDVSSGQIWRVLFCRCR